MEMVWDWKSITSILATIVFIRTAARDFIPPELRHFLSTLFASIYSSVYPTSKLIVEENDHSGSRVNELYEAIQCYLSSRCLSSSPVLRLSKSKNSKALISSLPSEHSASDVFDGVQMKWKFHSVERNSSKRSRAGEDDRYGYFELFFHQRYTEMVRERYVQHILDEAVRLKMKSRERKLYTNKPFGGHYGNDWSSIPFNHPSTFETLAIDPALRDSIRNDLLRFSSRREYYSRVGRSWKRGYLLYGPPGTGKTSLIAAIANFLEFDIYDLELTAVHSNSELRKLLVSTSTKSVIVIEDVDCSLDLSDRNSNTKKELAAKNLKPESDPGGSGKGEASTLFSTVSLSGVLNFVDGLWSSCVGERLVIFTTNHPERLDAALLRPGRMDRKIHLSYCEIAGFKVLAKNYMEVEEEHEMMDEVDGLLKKVKVTPADIAEIFMGCDGFEADFGMRKVVEELKKRIPAGGEEENKTD